MASFEPIDDFGHDEPPPRPTTPPVRRGFVLVLIGLSLAAAIVYGVPYVVERAGYAYEAGRARAAGDAIKVLEKQGKIADASSLFRLAAAKVSPAVVNIRAFRAAPGKGRNGEDGIAPAGIGSGVIIDAARGLIVTNHHVIKDGEQFTVRPSRGGEYSAQIVGVDPATDLAVLQVKAAVKVEAEWGDSENLAVGDWVLAIGSPYLLDQSVSAGIVSATERNRMGIVGEHGYENFIQTDAAVNPGNSGGALIDLRGKLVGINTAMTIEAGGVNGIGLAIPASLARKVAEDLIRDGHVTRGYLGVMLKDLSADEAALLKIPDGRGALIASVEPGSPAEEAGLRPDDVIVNLDGQPIADFTALRIKTSSMPIGATVPLGYIRKGQPETTKVTIGSLPKSLEMGFRLRDVKGEDGEPIVIVDQVQFGTAAQRSGLEPGARVLMINDKPVKTRNEADEAIAASDPKAKLDIQIIRLNGKLATVHLGGRANRK